MNTIYLRHINYDSIVAEQQLNAIPLVGDVISIKDATDKDCFLKVIDRMFHFNINNPTYDAFVTLNVADNSNAVKYSNTPLSKEEIEELDNDLKFESVTPALDNAIGFDKYPDRTPEVVTERCFSLPTKNVEEAA